MQTFRVRALVGVQVAHSTNDWHERLVIATHIELGIAGTRSGAHHSIRTLPKGYK